MQEQIETKAAWQHDRETGEHFLAINDDESWKVYRTAGGDYALTLHSDEWGCGDDIDYFNTLKQAKAEAEKRARALRSP